MAEIDLTLDTSNMSYEEKREYRHQLEAERDKYSAKIKSMYKEEDNKQFKSNLELVGRCYKRKRKHYNGEEDKGYYYGQIVSALSNNVYRIEAVEFGLPASLPRIVRPSRLMGWKDYEGYTFRCGELCGKSYMARDSKIELDQHLHDVEEITQEEFYEALTEFHKQIEEGLKKLIVEEQKREI